MECSFPDLQRALYVARGKAESTKDRAKRIVVLNWEIKSAKDQSKFMIMALATSMNCGLGNVAAQLAGS